MTVRRTALWSWAVPWLALVAAHWVLLGYGQPFGGQQSDDDYHYYSYAARFDAPDARALRAYRPSVPPDAVMDVYDESRIKISFSAFQPYPGWTWLLHAIRQAAGCSYQTAALLLFLVQGGLLIAGAQWLAAAVAPAASAVRWRLGAAGVCLALMGFEGIASPLLSIPMNFAVALSVAALGLLVHGRLIGGGVLLIAACVMHVAGIVIAAYVVTVWAAYRGLCEPRRLRWLARDVLSLTSAVAVSWAVLHYGMLGIGEAGMSGGLRIGFDKSRLDFLLRGHQGFFPLVGGAGLLACYLAWRAGETRWRLPAAVLAVSALYAVGFAALGNKYVNHPTLYPLGRLLYLVPWLSVLMAMLASWLVLAVWPRLALAARVMAPAAFGVVLLAAGWQSRQVVAGQLLPRWRTGLGPLYARLAAQPPEQAPSRTSFVFFNHEFGTVLGAAHLYEATHVWAKVYSPEALRAATAGSDRVVYFQGAGDPSLPAAGFCPVRHESVALGIAPQRWPGPIVQLVEAERC